MSKDFENSANDSNTATGYLYLENHKMHTVDFKKVKTLEDVIALLNASFSRFDVSERAEGFDKVKHLLKDSTDV